MKNELTLYKGFGTLQQSLDEDGRRCYIYNHLFFNSPGEESTLREAREMLDYYERKAQEIRNALNVLHSAGYKVFKQMA